MLEYSTAFATLLLALLIDMRLGEPPSRFHPVVWMGRYLNWAAHRTPILPNNPRLLFQRGAGYWLLGAFCITLISVLACVFIPFLPWPLQCIGLALLLKPTFAWRMLKNEVLAVEHALGESIEAGRQRVAYLCSRDVAELTVHQVRQTAIETLAENFNDSFVAPIFWFLLLGFPGAMLYRFSNTADAMWGYMGLRNGRDWTWFGQWAARADDAMSWVPARLTAIIFWGISPHFSFNNLHHEARKTPSPNSGWPMGAVALALNIQLEKPKVYILNPTGHSPEKTHTEQAIRLTTSSVYVIILLYVLCLLSTAFIQW